MSTSVSSDLIITRESGRCQRKPFLNLSVWARERRSARFRKFIIVEEAVLDPCFLLSLLGVYALRVQIPFAK